MHCPHCDSSNVYECKTKTSLGYSQYRCRTCCKQYNKRTGTPFNFIEYPNEVIMIAVHHYYRFKLSLSDVVELMAMRGFHLSHQTVHNWAQAFGVDLGLKLRAKRKNMSGNKWHVDATYLKVEGRWYYLYRAIDKQGDLVDVYLSNVRDQQVAEQFFKQALKTTGIIPEQITTDKETVLYSAIKNIFGSKTKHRDSKYKNNIIEQDHRGIKSRYKVMKGFKNIFCALIFCTSFEEIRQFFRIPNSTRARQRRLILSKIQTFNNIAMVR